MKLIRSQDKINVVNAKYIFHIYIREESISKRNSEFDIRIFYSGGDKGVVKTIATYRKADEAIRQLENLAIFLSSNGNSGLHQMP
ncbi:MAG: hypothetical protein FWD01_00875 [Defluviitaleaceae bacterium]|nr:hypothetical protein [Defluviitaleaceae bacterium]